MYECLTVNVRYICLFALVFVNSYFQQYGSCVYIHTYIHNYGFSNITRVHFLWATNVADMCCISTYLIILYVE
jgi:hypothetical protein